MSPIRPKISGRGAHHGATVLLEMPVGWGLSGARGAVKRAALAGGLDPKRADDLVIAANEVMTNALIHGGGAASLFIETRDAWLICRIADKGAGFEDRTVGGVPPVGERPRQGGMGLWMVRALCDDVSVGRADHGALVELKMRLSSSA